jgi:hypothetical protein
MHLPRWTAGIAYAAILACVSGPILAAQKPDPNKDPKKVQPPPSIPKSTPPVQPKVINPTGPKLVNPTGPKFVNPTGPKVINPTGPSVVNPTGPKVINPTGPKVVNPTGPKLVNPTGPKLVNPTGPKVINPTGPKVVNPTGPKMINPTGPKVVNPTGPKVINPTGPKVVNPTGPKVINPIGPKVVNPTGPKVINPTGPKVVGPTNPKLIVPPKKILPGGPNGTLKVGTLNPTIKVGSRINPVDPGKGKTRIDPRTLKIGGALAAGAVAGLTAHHLMQRPVRERFQDRQIQGLMGGKFGKDLHLKQQFDLQRRGDYARTMKLRNGLMARGGWQHRNFGIIDAGYRNRHRSMMYCGAGYYPKYCWCPHWAPWVNWCWNVIYVPGWYDPRPIYCQPVYTYEPCQQWVTWTYPTWTPLIETCGTWVDVPVVEVPQQGLDLQLLAVRFVDGGHPEEQQGPSYRVWYRNNSTVPITTPFDVLAYASNDRNPGTGPQGGFRITNIDAGAIQSVDIRLPYEATAMSQDEQGVAAPFNFLHVIVDAHREIPEGFEENNGAVMQRVDILPVDPSLFGVDQPVAAAGSTLSIGGEGFGPEPGQVILRVGDQDIQPKILGWFDLGVQIEVPQIGDVQQAELIVVRGDQAATNPYTIAIQTAGSVSP